MGKNRNPYWFGIMMTCFCTSFLRRRKETDVQDIMENYEVYSKMWLWINKSMLKIQWLWFVEIQLDWSGWKESDVAILENWSKDRRHISIKVLMSITRPLPLPRGKINEMGRFWLRLLALWNTRTYRKMLWGRYEKRQY